MVKISADDRSAERAHATSRLPQEPPVQMPEIPAGSATAPVEAHLDRLRRRPLAVVGIVENGLVRPLDSAVKLLEHSRVIIVTTDAT